MSLRYDTIEQLPEVVQDYLNSDQLADVNWEIFEKNKISSEQRGKILDAVSDVFLRKDTVQEFPARLARIQMKQEFEVKGLAAEIAMRVFYPARDYLGSVADQAHHWDADSATKTYSSTGQHFDILAETREQRIARLAKLRPEGLQKPQQKEAFEHFVTVLVDAGEEQFNEEEVQSQLVELGVVDIGFLQTLKKTFGDYNHMQQQKTANNVAEHKKETFDEDQLQQEVKSAAKQIQHNLGVMAGAHMPAEQEIREEIAEKVSKQVAGIDYVALEPIVLSRVKGVRDTRQFTQALMGAKNANNEQLDGDKAMKIVSIVEEVLARTPKSVSTIANAQSASTNQLQPEKAKADETFVKTVSKKSLKKEGVVQKQLGTIDDKHLLQTKEAAHPEEVQKPKPKVTPASEPYAQPISQPEMPQPEMKRLTDVRSSQGLTGPVQEVEQLRVIDLRRSAQDPETRIEKVLSAINRIGKENYPDKIQAIFAWRRSEPYQMYEQMVIGSLREGISLEEYIMKQTKARKPVLDGAEIAALIKGNTRLEQW